MCKTLECKLYKYIPAVERGIACNTCSASTGLLPARVHKAVSNSIGYGFWSNLETLSVHFAHSRNSHICQMNDCFCFIKDQSLGGLGIYRFGYKRTLGVLSKINSQPSTNFHLQNLAVYVL